MPKVAQASTTLMALINSLCVMLRTTPFHRENYARLILTVIIQFYQRCSDRFQALIASHPSVGHDTGIAIAAQWAQNPEVIACLSDSHHASVRIVAMMNNYIGYILSQETVLDKNILYRRERDVESQLMGDRPIEKGELIGPLRNVSALCNLYRSVVRLYILHVHVVIHGISQVVVHGRAQPAEGRSRRQLFTNFRCTNGARQCHHPFHTVPTFAYTS